MYKLLIVEDERWEREGLVSLIDRHRFSISEVLTAADGVAGLEYIRAEQPHLIITDIRMPGLSGLEMLQRAGDAIANTVCIILSGYNEFAYAKQALRIGAMDFLVKPINERELNDALTRAAATLARMPHANNGQNHAQLGRLMGEELAREAAEALMAQLDISQGTGLRAAALFGAKVNAAMPPYSLVADGITHCLLRPQDRLPEGWFEAAGISRIRDAQDVHAATKRAEKAMENARFHQLSVPLSYSVMAKGGRSSDLRRRMEAIALEQAMTSLDEAEVAGAIGVVRQRLKGDLGVDRARALEELSLLCSQQSLPADTPYAHTLAAMLDVVQNGLNQRISDMRKGLGESETYVLRRVIALVKEHFEDPDLNLQSIAAQVYLSPNYVGALFKKSTGVTFSDYLCRHRLMAAARLLAGQGMRVSSVAQSVGIPNVSYFCVQFRNAYGVTPSQFKKKQ